MPHDTSRFAPEGTREPAPPPSVCVIVPTFNEERYVGRCLDSVMHQDYPSDRLRVLVLDNGSTDRTSAIASSKGATVHIRPNLSVAGLRNEGVRLSESDIVAFLDADCVASRDWLRLGVESLSRERCITGAPYSSPHPAHWIEKAWHSTEKVGRYTSSHINAGNLLCWRSDFAEIGGFDESLVTGEDYEFSQRAAKRLSVIADSAIDVVHLGNPKTLGDFFRREVWHGLGALGSLRHNAIDKPLLATLAFGVGIGGMVVGILVRTPLSAVLILSSAAMILGVVVASTIVRVLRRPPGLVAALQLSLLFFVFYLGRLTALARIVLGRRAVRRTK